MHDIDTGSTRPILCNPRKLSPKKIKIQQELVDKMLEEGQIKHSVSAWSAPTVLVNKKDGTTRFCVDYRRLNNSTKKTHFRYRALMTHSSHSVASRGFQR